MAVEQPNYTNLSVEAIREEVNSVIVRELIPVMVYLGILAVFGGLGNLLVCFVYYFRLQMSTQHFLIICLAVFDLLSCFVAIPFEINDLNYYFKFSNQGVCKVLRFLTHFCNFVSILTLLVIAIDRYRKVCRPLKPQMVMSDVKMALAINLSISVVLAVPPTVIYGLRTTKTYIAGVSGNDCSTRDDLKDTLFPLLFNSFLFIAFVGITVALVALYSQIWREMRRHSRYMARNSDAMKSSVRTERSSGSEGPNNTVRDLPQKPSTTTASASLPPAFSTIARVNFRKSPDSHSSRHRAAAQKVADSDERASLDSDLMSLALQSDVQAQGQGRENGAFKDEEGQPAVKGQKRSDVEASLMECVNMLDCDDASHQVEADEMFKDATGEDGYRPDENRTSRPRRSFSARREADPEEREHMSHNPENGRDDITCEQYRFRDGCSGYVATPAVQCRCTRTSSDSMCSCDKERSKIPSNAAEADTRPQTRSEKIVTISESCDFDYRHEDRAVRLTLFRRLASYLGSRRKTSEDSAAKLRVAGLDSLRSFRTSSRVTTRATRKATVIAFSITAVFILSFLPHLSLLTARIVTEDFDKSLRGANLVFYNIFLRSYFVNSASNPIIYGVLNARFRTECLSLICYLLTFGRKQVEVRDSLSH